MEAEEIVEFYMDSNFKNLSVLLLAAGVGSRLMPLTDSWPKCLMPIGKKPLLEYWLNIFYKLDINKVMVNLHYKSEIVESFLQRDRFKDWVASDFEPVLLGTAGTLKKHMPFFLNDTLLLIHADNWSQCDISAFIEFHSNDRPENCLITMMTFHSDQPSECGIVELDDQNRVIKFHEKVQNPPSNLANAAVYLIEPEVLRWIDNKRNISDFSNDVLPNFLGKIATWHNDNIHRDIGTLKNLQKAQLDKKPNDAWSSPDKWELDFHQNPIHGQIKI